MRKTTVAPSIISAALIVPFMQHAFAHGKAEHGGAFTEVREYTFEVVTKEREHEEKGKHQEPVDFSVYIKDPHLKPVAAGSGTVAVWRGKKQVAQSNLSGSNGVYTANAVLPDEGRYKLAINFTPEGAKQIKANVSVKVD